MASNVSEWCIGNPFALGYIIMIVGVFVCHSRTIMDSRHGAALIVKAHMYSTSKSSDVKLFLYCVYRDCYGLSPLKPIYKDFTFNLKLISLLKVKNV